MVLHHTASEILHQLIEFTEQCHDTDFKKPLPVLMNKTLGKHIRHIVEFFELLMKGYLSGEISYDHRMHDPSIEENRQLALKKLQEIAQKLGGYQTDRVVVLEVDYTQEGQDRVMKLNSSFMRELSYNIEHAIHHMAIIKMAVLHDLPHLTLAPQFGVAYATIRFEKAH